MQNSGGESGGIASGWWMDDRRDEEDCLMTNWHIFGSISDAIGAKAVFDYSENGITV